MVEITNSANHIEIYKRIAAIEKATRVVVKMVDALILIAKPEFRCRFDFWTIISQLFSSLYGIPEKDAVTIHEGGMRFGSRDAKQPQTKLFKYIKYYTSNYLPSSNI